MNSLKNKQRILLNIAYIFIVAMFFIGDRILKKIAINQGLFDSLPIFGDILKFRLLYNKNIAFSLPVSGPILTIAIAIIILTLAIYLIYLLRNRSSSRIIVFIFSLILFGALSNFIDRILYGAVIDYLDLKLFTVFNLADLMISGGLIVYLFNHKKIELSK